MNKSMIKMLIFVSIFFLLVFGWYGVKQVMIARFMSHYQPPPMTISATKATSKTWKPYISTVGSITAVNGVDIAPEVAGVIEEIHFQSGDSVKKGDVLITLQSQIEKANLKNNQAKLQLAKLNYEREKVLYSKKVSSQAILDSRYAELQQAEASVASIDAAIKQKTLTAPFDGKLGIRQVNTGQFLSPGMPVVTLQSLNPLYVMFNVTEQNLPSLHIGQNIDVALNVNNNKTVSGKITAINSKVDPSTRNILVQATIRNDNEDLYPGMYGLVKIWLDQEQNTIVIPQTAISYGLSGDYVFVVKDERKNKTDQPLLKVYRQFVKVKERRGDQASIDEGLKKDDWVVTAGQLKLQNGTTVLIDNSVKL